MILTLTILVGTTSLLGGGYITYRYKKAQKSLPFYQNEDLSLKKLQPKVSWCRYLENVSHFGLLLSNQYQMIQNLYASSIDILNQKFHIHELTYGRYQQIIMATNHLLIDNIVKLIPLLEALDSVAGSEMSNKPILIENIERFFTLNNALIEKLNDLMINLSQLKNLTGFDESHTHFLIENLSHLIERAKSY